jgi:hypothetical protein
MSLAPALLLTAMQAAPALPAYANPVEFFLQVCTQGEARIDRGRVEQVRRIPPGALSQFLRQRRTHQYFRVRLDDGPAFLAIQDTGEAGSPENRRYCSVASSNFSYEKAGLRIDPFFGSPSGRLPFNRRFHLSTSSLGYQIAIERLENRYLVMTSVLPAEPRPDLPIR